MIPVRKILTSYAGGSKRKTSCFAGRRMQRGWQGIQAMYDI
jgi:hypothetical protein